MFGLDQWVASFSDGATLALVCLVAVALGLRHATDPDHLAAVTTLIAGTRERATGAAARLGLSWGVGHATTLFAFGLPIVLFQSYLPERVQEGAETTVGIVIIALAVSLLRRWHQGVFHTHAHPTRTARTPLRAFAIGLVHGMGGSAGVGLLLLASIHDRSIAVAALGLFALCTALSMALLSTGLGLTFGRGRIRNAFPALAPLFGLMGLSFGVWYALGALHVAPYYF
jgi:high-affinity nickel permease